MNRTRLLLGLAALVLVADTAIMLLVAPTSANTPAPLTWRTFYFHVPTAWVAYLAFVVTAVASLAFLRRPSAERDAWALASAELGTLFAAIALVTGLVWSRREFFNYSPIEDPKVISLAVVVFAYLGYLALRRNVEEPERRARLAAVYGLLAFLAVPLSYFASRASVHPDFTRPEQSLDPRLGAFLLVSTLAFTAAYGWLLVARQELALVAARLEEAD